jgi:putative copper export protein/methionine-rich copper-binding protein CopC
MPRKLLNLLIPRRRVLLLAAALACVLLPSAAAAHTRVQRTAPADGDTAADVREIRVRFSQGVESELTTLTVLRGGVRVAAGGAQVPESDGREYVLALLAALEPGAYEVRWKTAGGDGHVLQGTFRFVVSAPPAPLPPAAPSAHTAPPPVAAAQPVESGPPLTEAAAEGEEVGEAGRPLAVMVRWGWFASLLGIIGVVAFRYGVLPRLDREPAHHVVAERAEAAAWFIALGAAALSAATLLLRLWLQAAALGGDAWNGERLNTLLTQTGWGLAWVLQAIATVAFVMGLFVSRAPYGRAAGWMGAAAGAVLLSAVPALSGHAASVDRLAAVAILSDTLHVLGAGVWLGTLLAVLAVGIPAAMTVGPDASGAVVSMVRAFSPIALAGAAAVGITGLVNGLFQVDAVPELWTTLYGRALLVKLALLASVAALGFYNWRVVLPALDGEAGAQRLRRSARLELGMGLVVLLVTAVLVALPTP